MEIIIAVAQSTMECMLITNPVIMTHGEHALMKIAMLGPTKRHLADLPNLQMLPPKNFLSMISFKMYICTQAGLSAEAVDRIWQDAQGNE